MRNDVETGREKAGGGVVRVWGRDVQKFAFHPAGLKELLKDFS